MSYAPAEESTTEFPVERRRARWSDHPVARRFTRRDTFFLLAIGYLAGTWIGIHLAMV
jgi:hypothetical protein